MSLSVSTPRKPGSSEVGKPAFVIEMSRDELACRILEAVCGEPRPRGMTASQAMDVAGETGDEIRRAAVAAIEYFGECMNGRATVQ